MIKSPRPLVSVVVPVYNEAQHISECIESVLAQTYQNWDCIVANNCSTDGSGEIARKYAAKDPRIRVFDNEQFVRAGANFNGALRKISPSAKYCKVVFSDDWIFPECLERMVEVAEEFETIGIVGAYGLQGTQVLWSGLPYPSRFVSGREVCRKAFLENLYVFGTATSLLYRADLVRNRDPFYNESNLHSDMEVCTDLLRDHDFGFVHQVLSFTREEAPGCLRSISEDLHTYVAGRFRNLAVYGRHFLSPAEYESCMKRSVSGYYDILAGGVLRARGKRFWDYHKNKMADVGQKFSWARVAVTVLRKFGIAIFNPLATLNKVRLVVSELVRRRAKQNVSRKELRLRVGDWVEVRSKEEILKTLDSKGELDGMPFMPEMFAFCGKKMKVYKVAHKTCDTVFPIRGRRVEHTVHLETRCDGTAHGGCQAQCLLFWKQAWLRPLSEGQSTANIAAQDHVEKTAGRGCAELNVWSNTSICKDEGTSVYRCQATQLPYATSDLAWWDPRQYVKDFVSGNVRLWEVVRGLLYASYYNLSRAGIGLGGPMRWIYNKASVLWGGPEWPRKQGIIAQGQLTPAASLNLQPGELVRVKPYEEILKTLTTNNVNRGLYWDAEMVPYCGGTYRVLTRVTRLINEKNGEMSEIKTPCVILESVVCQARYSNCRMFCPRSIYPYWREIWLERVGPALVARTETELEKVDAGNYAPSL